MGKKRQAPATTATKPATTSGNPSYVKDDEGNYVDFATGRYPKDASGKDIVSKTPPQTASGGKGQGAKEWFSNVDNIKGLVEAGVGLGAGIAGAVKKPKEGGGGDGGGGGGYTPTTDDNLILGMSKPLFFGLVGGVVLIAGVGIFFAVRGSGDAGAPAPAAK